MSFVYKCDCIYVQEGEIRKDWYKHRCKTWSSNKREFVKVDLNKDGNCIHCGHSVVAFPEYVYPRVKWAGGDYRIACRATFTNRGFSRKQFDNLKYSIEDGNKDWTPLNRSKR